MIGPIFRILPIATNPGIVPPWLQNPITIQPWPLPEPDNGGIVPPWLERDLGAQAADAIRGRDFLR